MRRSIYEKFISFKKSSWKNYESSHVTITDRSVGDILSTENPDETTAFNIAKNEEIKKWEQMNDFEEVHHLGQPKISS